MPSPYFEFFEVLADVLSVEPTRVFTRSDLESDDEHSTLLADLKSLTGANTSEQAIIRTVTFLSAHFNGKGSTLPFEYISQTGQFTAIDRDYLEFVVQIASIRSVGKRSNEFEKGVMQRLKLRATGSLHRVGHPRDHLRTRPQFSKYLRELGFGSKVVYGKEKDAGLDILWMLPLGTVPHRPMISVQCKNGAFNLGEADKSLGPLRRTLSVHEGLQQSVHVPCVMFNDYIHSGLPPKPLEFVPLGLSDLGLPSDAILVNAI